MARDAVTSDADRLLADLAAERGADLLSYAYLLTGDVAAAQDLVQDAMVKVFVRLRRGFTPQTAEAYVRRTILTLYVDGYRRRRHWAGLTHLVARGDVTEGPELSGADRVDLRAALDVLSPQERACVVLRFYEDLTVPEVASRLRLADGTVKRYLSNAVRKLEVRLGPVPTHDTEDVLVTSAHDPSTRTARSHR